MIRPHPIGYPVLRPHIHGSLCYNPREDDAPECHGMAQISGQSTFPNLLSYQLRGVLELSLNPSSPVLSAQVF